MTTPAAASLLPLPPHPGSPLGVWLPKERAAIEAYAAACVAHALAGQELTGLWVLTGPDGRRYVGRTKFEALKAETDFRIPPELQLRNVQAAVESSLREMAEDDREAHEDKARLDWIMDHMTTRGGGNGFTLTCFVPHDCEDLRHAIDAARKS